MVLCDDDTATPFMCPPYAEVVLCDGGGGRAPGAVHVDAVLIRWWEAIPELSRPWCGRRRRPHRRVGDDREDGAPVTRRVLVEE